MISFSKIGFKIYTNRNLSSTPIRLLWNYSSHRSQQHNELFHCPLPPLDLKLSPAPIQKRGTVWSTGVLKRSRDMGKGCRCGKWFQEVDLYQQKDWTQAHKMSWMERTTDQVLLYPPDGLDYKEPILCVCLAEGVGTLHLLPLIT